jgi:thymidylate synthase
MQITVDSYAEAYTLLRSELLTAKSVCPRGKATKEVLGVTIHLKNPRARLGWHPDRKYSLPLYVAESVMLFSASDSVEHLAYINPRMQLFSDNGKTLYGAYGNRIHNEIRDVIRKLKEDPDTRQAVLPIIREFDLRVQTKDFPCTQVLQFMIREKKLHLFVTMRSNDFIWGLQYDLPVFTTFQEIIANTLGLEVGEYWHTANSLHVYDYHFELLDAIQTLHSIEFSVPYKLGDMDSIYPLVAQIHEGYSNAVFSFPEYASSLFHRTLKAFLDKKERRPFEPFPQELQWAEQFVQY